ncbi:putative transmembrane protein 244 isoform X3 [Syngnathoides biaculeatus]|nr:putative transmembrane protein 244 isoform X3 [Syngnathoides biaculeatus]
MIGSVCFGAFRLDDFDGRIPFDFKTKPEDSASKYLVNLLSLELTYFCSGLLFAAVVKRRVWDYALTVTCLHVFISSLGERSQSSLGAKRVALTLFMFRAAVMLEFPLAWRWWLALGSGLVLMVCNGQLIAYLACQDDQSYVTFTVY